jgi:arginyl-tRNA--protein-N-Asp/Glu arginylyltransferase
MKLLFSECKSDYGHYVYPYAIWAIPEPGETPAQFFDRGFMPGTPNLERFYLCRHLRVDLKNFQHSSENRRILRKGAGVTGTLIPRAQFDYTPARRETYRAYADERWGRGIMSEQRLDGLFDGKVVSHVLLFRDSSGAEVGVAVLYVEEPAMAFYYYAFYDLAWMKRSLGMFMMTWAVDFFAQHGFRHLYLGTCYSERALYKTQFAEVEFFNGFRWSTDLEELKHLIRREQSPVHNHLLATPEFRDQFYGGELARISDASAFRLPMGPD